MSDIETTENNKNNLPRPVRGSPTTPRRRAHASPGRSASSILRAARDELYLGMRFLGCGAEQLYLSDGWFGQSVWNRRGCNVLPSGTAWRAL